ncbi:MAG: hypothetical protein AAGC68_15480, partial [Verrucomicrobiota bacterium]
MNELSSRRRFILRSLGATFALPGLTSLAASANKPAALAATRGAGVGAKRFVAIGNLLVFQQKSFFPETTGAAYEATE